LHVIAASAADAPGLVSDLVRGKGLRGAATRIEGRRVIVLIANDGETDRNVALGGSAEVLVVVGLVPGKRYRASFEAGGACHLRLSESKTAGDPQASSGGALRIDATRCGGR
jgi:hypothetical protein